MSQPSPRPDDEISPLLHDPNARAWFEQHRTQLHRNAYGQGFLYSTLAITFVVGLVVYVVGYLLRSNATTEPLGLLADLTYTFGFALWTAAVIVVLIEIIPEAKRRQVRRALEAYEAVRLEQAQTPDKDAIQQS
jgi:F0F1-type ATP synthase assembly protein I